MRCGFVAVGGRPNVGKSTLFNRLVGPKLSIVSRRKQTTRTCVRGVLTEDDAQFIFIDTPGWQRRDGGLINRALNSAAAHTLPHADAGVLVIAGKAATKDDRRIAEMFDEDTPVVAVLNKADKVRQRELMLPLAEEIASWREFAAIIPASALTGEGVEAIKEQVRKLLPEGPALYPPSQLSDRDDGFFAAELIRERLFGLLGAELPYHCAVIINRLAKQGSGTRKRFRIDAEIVVDTRSRKAICIGAGGSMLKRIGSTARPQLEGLLGGRVHLDLQVRLRRGWTEANAELARLGIVDR